MSGAASCSSGLSQSVLVLNRLYLAVHIVSARRAFSLLFKELAEVVSIEDGQYCSYDFQSWRELSELKAQFKEPEQDWISTVSLEIEVPRIVRLLTFDRIPRQAVKFNRRNIFARDKNQCQYCGKTFSTCELTLDHVIPRTQGGKTTWENIVCCCVDCNVRKGGRTPDQAAMKLKRFPFKPATSPQISLKLGFQKYQSWKTFLDAAYWTVELK